MPVAKSLRVKDIMSIKMPSVCIYHDLVASVVAALEAKDHFIG